MTTLRHILAAALVSAFACQASAQQTVKVNFDQNYSGSSPIEAVTLTKGECLSLENKPVPSREGYRFAGWFTDKSCSDDSRWIFGKKAGGMWGAAADSMAVGSDMTLYAKWNAPVHVKTAADFDRIREDLYGWYILDNDIDLSSYTDWSPIGNYNSSYEYADAEWWDDAFHGVIDGSGHKITGFRLTNRTGFVNTLVGSLAGGEMRNITVENPIVDLSGEFIYASPLLGYMKNDSSASPVVENCHVTGADIRVKVTSQKSEFSGATALVMAGWGGVVRNCSASGKIHFEIGGLPAGGELYVGALNGECYCNMENCTSDVDIVVLPSKDAALNGVKTFVGGIQASATNTSSCIANGTIVVTDNPGFENLCIGGIAGSERYGTIKDCTSNVLISVNEKKGAHVGGVIGEFSQQYGMIGALVGISETVISNCKAAGVYPVSGAGVPDSGASMFGLAGMKYIVK